MARRTAMRFACLTFAGLTLALAACGDAPPNISAGHGWTRATSPGQTSASVYFTISNHAAGADRLLAVSSPAANEASLHRGSSDNGIARMRAITDGLPIPGNTVVRLEPGRNHAMLTGLVRPLSPGQTIQLQVQFERSGTRKLPVDILAAESGPPPMTDMRH